MRNIGQVVNQSPSAFLEFMYKLYATEKSSLVYHVSDLWLVGLGDPHVSVTGSQHVPCGIFC